MFSNPNLCELPLQCLVVPLGRPLLTAIMQHSPSPFFPLFHTPLFNGFRGYNPQENFGIKDACR